MTEGALKYPYGLPELIRHLAAYWQCSRCEVMVAGDGVMGAWGVTISQQPLC